MEAIIPNKTPNAYNRATNRPWYSAKNRSLQTAKPHEKDWHWNVSPLPLWTGSTNHSPFPAAIPSSQKRKRKHLANRKFPRKQTPWNSHRPTPDGAVHRPDVTTNITSLHRTLKKKNKLGLHTCERNMFDSVLSTVYNDPSFAINLECDFGSNTNYINWYVDWH